MSLKENWNVKRNEEQQKEYGGDAQWILTVQNNMNLALQY